MDTVQRAGGSKISDFVQKLPLRSNLDSARHDHGHQRPWRLHQQCWINFGAVLRDPIGALVNIDRRRPVARLGRVPLAPIWRLRTLPAGVMPLFRLSLATRVALTNPACFVRDSRHPQSGTLSAE